jgi:hypothetical protein
MLTSASEGDILKISASATLWTVSGFTEQGMRDSAASGPIEIWIGQTLLSPTFLSMLRPRRDHRRSFLAAYRVLTATRRPAENVQAEVTPALLAWFYRIDI